MREHMNVSLRPVEDADIEIFFQHQRDADANAMAGFPAREYDAHVAHWRTKVLGVPNAIALAIVVDGSVAGNVVSWIQDGERLLGYWLGKEFWGRGIASSALRQFVDLVDERPLYGHVAPHNAGSIRVLEKAGFTRHRSEDDLVVYVLEK